MDKVWVALALSVPLIMGGAWAVSFLAIDTRREGRLRALRHHARDDHAVDSACNCYARPGHRFRGQGEAITVAELLEDAIERGVGIRLNWPEDDLDRSPIQADEQGQFPTVVLPSLHDLN
ncbi:MAG: hypothetical protein ACJ72N_07770 [Labedaea sp.]